MVLAAIILVAYLFKMCKRYFRKAQKSGLTLDLNDGGWDNSYNNPSPGNQESFVPKGPPTPRTKAMMEADPMFNPNKIEHRIQTLEALGRTSETLLAMEGKKIGDND